MSFSDNSNVTLSDSFSGYLTANEGDETENTQYLSVINPDVSFDSINITLCNSQENEDNAEVEVPENEEQPFIFTIDGSNEIFGVQVASDQDGNFQKYQIQYMENANGELVPMIETIQMLPPDEEVEVEALMDTEQESISNNLHSAISQEDSSIQMKPSHTDIFESCEIEEEIPLAIPQTFIKNDNSTFNNEIIKEKIDENSAGSLECSNVTYVEDRTESEALLEINDNLIQMEEYTEDNIENQNVNEENEVNEPPNIEHIFLEESHFTNDQIEENENDSDNEIYQIVDMPDIECETVLRETPDDLPKGCIVKTQSPKHILKDEFEFGHKVMYIHTTPEKENVENVKTIRFPKSNSRSLLKCNQPTQPLKMVVPDTASMINVTEDKFVNRFSRTKEAKQARQFINFINSTTIPQVPERKGRLPRKQQIKPVQHPNEDIVVKEMIVSSNSFIEPISAEDRKKLPITDYVELLDSGDENSETTKVKKKEKAGISKKPIEIEISDSDESNVCMVDLDNHKRGDENESSKASHKKRIRSPKISNIDKKDSGSNLESPPKISRIEKDVDYVTTSLEIFQVGNETATNLNSNIRDVEQLNEKSKSIKPSNDNKNIRCLVNSKLEFGSKDKELSKVPLEAKKTISIPGSKQKIGFEYKYECEKCQLKFINQFLLKRHDCVVKPTQTREICRKKFPSLKDHNKIHEEIPKVSKVNTVKNTRMSTLPLRSSLRTLEPISHSKNADKSKGAIPKTVISKTSNPETTTRASERTLSIPQSSAALNKTPKSNVFKFHKQCDKCLVVLHSNAAWFDHQVLKHGYKTPDKSIGEKEKRIAKKIIAHSGLSAGPTIAKNFSIMKKKIQEQLK